MNGFLRHSLLVVCSSSQLTLSAQDSPAPTPQPQGVGQRVTAPESDQHPGAPKDITGDEVSRSCTSTKATWVSSVSSAMPATQKQDATTSPPMQTQSRTKRVMIKMTDDLNAKYLTQLTITRRPTCKLRNLSSRHVTP